MNLPLGRLNAETAYGCISQLGNPFSSCKTKIQSLAAPRNSRVTGVKALLTLLAALSPVLAASLKTLLILPLVLALSFLIVYYTYVCFDHLP